MIGLRRALALAVLLGTGAPARPAAAAPQLRQPTEVERAAVAIEAALKRHAGDVHRCFERALADRLDVAGKVEMEVELLDGGRVGKARVLSQGEEISPALSGCVLASATAWRVDGIEPGSTVVLPFAFQGQMSQFVVKTEDVPERALGGAPAPAAAAAKGKAKGAGPARPAPFTVKVLADAVNVRATQISLTLLSIGPASRVAMHRHPRSAKALYLLKGHARLLGPQGTAPQKLDEGSAVFVPAGYPHVIENMGRQSTAVFLQAFAPPGPERVYRNPQDVEARADFEVIRDPKAATLPPPGAGKLVVVSGKEAAPLPIPGLVGKGAARILLDETVTGSKALALDVVEFEPGTEVPRHSHAGSTEVLYVLSGGGSVTVGSESTPFAAEQVIHVPAGQPHASKLGPGEKTIAVQLYAPAGPEQRFRQAAAPAAAPGPGAAPTPTPARPSK